MPDLSTVHQSIQAIWHIDSARVIAVISRVVNDIGLAEDFAQEALLAATEQWPRDGIPENPTAWLTTVGKRKATDYIRHQHTAQRLADEVAHQVDLQNDAANTSVDDLAGDIKDDMLRLIFTACHPALTFDAQAALALRILCGLSAEEIARAFLISEAAAAKRLVRAKQSITEQKIPFEIPEQSELPSRLHAVIEVIYLLFNEGYSATSGENWYKGELCDDAMRIGRMLAAHIPMAPEVHGLIALMELQASRLPARTGTDGEPILLPNQDRRLWDKLLIQRGLAALDQAESIYRHLGVKRGPITLQAAIAACHARTLFEKETKWPLIVDLYEELLALTPSPVIELNRAVAVSMAQGPSVGLELVNRLSGDSQLKNYHLLPSVKGDLLLQLGRYEEAKHEFEQAADMAQNVSEKILLFEKAKQCSGNE